MTPTVGEFSFRGWPQEIFSLPRYGMTFEPLGNATFQCRQTLSTADSPAKTFQLQDAEQAWKESEAAYFSRCLDSWMKFDPYLSSWKTSPTFVQKDWPKPLGTFPREGLIVGGYAYPLRKSEPRTSENAGFYLPTPTATSGGYNQSMGPNSQKRLTLATMARKNQWPTPSARDWKGTCNQSSSLPNYVEDRPAGGRLNPTWVEWLMGYQSEWTVCEPWAMPSSRRKHEKRLSD